MGGVLLAEYVKSFVKSSLLYQTVSGKISTRGVSCYKVLLREEALGSCVVSCGEVDLGKPEGIFIVF